MGNTVIILCPRCKERSESYPHFIFHCKLSQITLNFISELINGNVFPHSRWCKARNSVEGNLCMKMDITKFINFLIIGEMSSFASISSDKSIELGSQESFLKKWNSLLNINGTLNIQFD